MLIGLPNIQYVFRNLPHLLLDQHVMMPL